MPDYYKILGIPKDADGLTTREAYIRLIKRHHPDALPKNARGDDAAKEINAAFAVLRDPKRRASYDSGVQPRTLYQPSGPAPGAVPVSHPPQGALNRSRRGLKGMVALLLLGMAGGLAAVGGKDFGQSTSLSGAWARGSAPDVLAVPEVQVPIDGDSIRDATEDLAWIVAEASIRDSVRYSISCYEQLQASPSIALLDRCVAFDLATMIWLRGDAGRRNSSDLGFFDPEVQEARSERSMKLLAFSPAATRTRLEALKRRTTLVLSKQLWPQLDRRYYRAQPGAVPGAAGPPV